MTDRGTPAGEWRLVREEALDGATAMALDAVAAETAAGGGPRTVRLYRWEPSTLSLGYRQDQETVDWAFCEREGVDVVRRPTGGGGIYHDAHGDISYSIVAPADEVPGDLMETYEWFCEPLFDAFDALGVDAGYVDEEREALYEPACYLRPLHPAHDVVAGDGRKLSGNAQYRTREAVVQHGSVSFEVDAERHLACFSSPEVTPEAFRERVTGVAEQASGVARERAVRAFEEALAAWCGADEGTWTDAERERAAEIADGKYRSEAWNRDRVDPLDDA